MDKITNITSNHVVKRIRDLLQAKKVGHGGALDPLATGVLMIGVGDATKLLNGYLNCDKEYTVTARLGLETDTLDVNGRIIQAKKCDHVTKSMIEDILPKFLGETMQIPPLISAKKYKGLPMYKYVRANREIPDPQPQSVTITKIKLLDFKPMPVDEINQRLEFNTQKLIRMGEKDPLMHDLGTTFTISMECSKGTYVRSVVRDIGIMLGSAAHAVELRRTRQGEFDENSLIKFDEISLEKLLK